MGNKCIGSSKIPGNSEFNLEKIKQKQTNLKQAEFNKMNQPKKILLTY